MRLLLVEDEDGIRSALARGLTQAGHQVLAAADLAQARALAAAGRIDALVSDLKLPDGHGLDLAGELGVPFVLMTGYGSFDDAVAALRLGCIDFFTKPISIKELRRAVERLAARVTGGPVVIDPERGRLVHDHGGRAHPETLRWVAATWTDAATTQTAFAELVGLAPTVGQRLALAELLQAAPGGRAVINLFGDRWLVWLDGAVEWSAQVDRRALLTDLAIRARFQDDGALLELAAVPPAEVARG